MSEKIDLGELKQKAASLGACGECGRAVDDFEVLVLIAIVEAAIAVRDVSCSCRCCRGLADTRYAGECSQFDAETAFSDALDKVTP